MKPFLLGLGLSLIAAMMVIEQVCHKILRSQHPDAWKELGAPSRIMFNGVGTKQRMRRFIRKREFLSLNDDRLNRLYWWDHALGLAAIATIIALGLLVWRSR